MPRDVFTTGDIARICRVAPRTALNWLYSGLLGGYRLPLSRDWRVTRESLVRFLEENGMPIRFLIEYEIEKAYKRRAKIASKKSVTTSE